MEGPSHMVHSATYSEKQYTIPKAHASLHMWVATNRASSWIVDEGDVVAVSVEEDDSFLDGEFFSEKYRLYNLFLEDKRGRCWNLLVL